MSIRILNFARPYSRSGISDKWENADHTSNWLRLAASFVPPEFQS